MSLLPWRRIDEATQSWVRATGRPVDLDVAHWLQGPVGDVSTIRDAWLDGEAARLEAVAVRDGSAAAGLLHAMASLDGDGFDADALHPSVRDFYERTSRWRLDARVGWSAWAWPGGWLIAAVFARRLQQLALPLRPAEVARGMSSEVVPLVRDGRQVAALWLRTLRSTGGVVFSGLYGVTVLPEQGRRAIRVSFPLPNGRLVVLLTPAATAAGGLVLTSGPGRWGDPGAYLVVERGGSCWARRIPVHERFHVFVDEEGVLRCDHRMHLGPAPVLELRYRMTPTPRVR